jgi:rhodanese-related sulfurtransferase
VARDLMKLGFSKAYALKGGWREWVKANFPIQKK